MRRLPLLAVLVAALLVPGQAAAAHAPRARAAIVGGSDALAGSWPSVAFVQWQLDANTYGECTGTVVAPTLVLTAAHCAEDLDTGVAYAPSSYLVATGRLDFMDSASGQVLHVARTIVYPGFNPNSLAGDAALLVLAAPTTAPAMAIATSSDAALETRGTSASIAGWGETFGGDPNPPTQLQTATTVMDSATDCRSQASAQFFPFSSTYNLCTLDTGRGTCHGDSGGPLAVQRGGGSWVEIGITSFGDPNCDTTLPSYYTRVATISSWVASPDQPVVAVSLPPAAAPAPTPAPAAPAPAPAAPVATPPAPAPASALDGRTLGLTEAKGYVRTALRLRFGTSFTRGRHYRAMCWNDTRLQVSCNVTWDRSGNDYWGRVTVGLTTSRGRVVWTGRLAVRRASNRCLIARPKRRCPTRLITAR